MVDSAARVVRIRTTQDDGGRACGIVTGTGATPQLALAALRREAEGLAQQAGQEANEVFEKAAAQEAAQEAARASGWRARTLEGDVHPGRRLEGGRKPGSGPKTGGA
jgi:hypothetical protein